ncbi:type II toxin-antitoxin system VapC family toxin [Roseateles sp.]|uniref:type II toxin-antitoxin system VapC family toxin n=1 Tax=Roseateles sp. TaxID=1971397 RepID=UPI00326588DF
MRILFDSSALLKRYLPEAGRDAVLAWVQKADAIMVAPHTKLELHSALARLQREAALTADSLRGTGEEIERSFADVEVLPFTPQLERAAVRALYAAPVRAMDALHVGAAWLTRADLFITADRRQAAAARAMGLPTELLE